MNFQEMKDIFESEFSSLKDKFVIIEEALTDLKKSTKEFIWHPGVYVFVLDGTVIKVGRHLTNSRKRALEHIIANTRNDEFEMKSLENCSNCKVFLFNLRNPDDYFWSASLEMFLEKKLEPKIKSKRQG